MSTKIYNAYKFEGSFDDLLTELKKIKTMWLEGVYKHILLHKDDQLSPYTNWYDLRNYILKESKKITFENFNFGTCYAFVAPYKNNIYCKFFDFHPISNEIYDYINDNPNFQDYHYQNSSDAYWELLPVVTSEELEWYKDDWEERKNTWDDILGGNGYAPFIDSGFTYNFFTQHNISEICIKIFDEKSLESIS